MKYIVPLLLGPLLVAAFAVAYWGPVRGYSVECRKDVQITCAIERETSSATTAHRFTLGSDPKAVVRVKDVRKGPDRILLYLVSSVGEVFAAEFEGGSALSEAEAAAARRAGREIGQGFGLKLLQSAFRSASAAESIFTEAE